VATLRTAEKQRGLKASEAPARGYPEEYFANIIEDPKMLEQLCDEVREHL
jgi:hypothetical protein